MANIQGPGSTPPPQKSQSESESPNWRLELYNINAYRDAWNIKQAIEDIMDELNLAPPVPANIENLYKQILADFQAVGTGAPPTKEACEKFIKDVENFKNLIQGVLSGSRFQMDMDAINSNLPKFEQWLDAGEPKA